MDRTRAGLDDETLGFVLQTLKTVTVQCVPSIGILRSVFVDRRSWRVKRIVGGSVGYESKEWLVCILVSVHELDDLIGVIVAGIKPLG